MKLFIDRHPLCFPRLKTHYLLLIFLFFSCSPQPDTVVENCEPTLFDEIGPFYRPNAPVRNSVGTGYKLSGRVLSTEQCKPLKNAMIEFWLVNSDGEYDDAHRATVFAGKKGEYFFESNKPVDYVGRLPHIHIRITAKNHQELITQHYPEKGATASNFDIVLEPQTK